MIAALISAAFSFSVSLLMLPPAVAVLQKTEIYSTIGSVCKEVRIAGSVSRQNGGFFYDTGM